MTEDLLIEVEGEPVLLEVSSTEDTQVLEVGEQGPAGPPGASASAQSRWLALQALSGHRAVVFVNDAQVNYADNRVPEHAFLLAGVSGNAAAQGTEITVFHNDVMTEPSWNWTPQQPVFLGQDGHLTQALPLPPAVFSLVLGYALSPTSMRVYPQPPIFI